MNLNLTWETGLRMRVRKVLGSWRCHDYSHFFCCCPAVEKVVAEFDYETY